MRVFVF